MIGDADVVVSLLDHVDRSPQMHAVGQIDGIGGAFRIPLRIGTQAEGELKPSRFPLRSVWSECNLPDPAAKIPAHFLHFAVPDPWNGGRKIFTVTISD